MKIAQIVVFIFLLCYTLAGCKELPPEANFTAAPTEGVAPLEIQFSDQSVGEIDTWNWDFDNDGVVGSVLQNPQYTYNEPRTYTVKLTVENSGGSDYKTKINYLRVTPPCKVDFMAEPTEVTGIIEIKFTDLSTGKVTSWAWDFDNDGIIDSTERNPTHSYTRNGDYAVTLTIIGPDCKLSITKDSYIHVSGCGG